MDERSDSGKTDQRLFARVVRFVLGVVLLGMGAAIAFQGVHSIRARSYALPWRSVTTWDLGPFSRSVQSQGVDLYVGKEATRMGLGLVASGVLLGLWGVALLGGVGRPWGRRQATLSAASLVSLSAALVLFFPPWRIFSEPSCSALYAVLFVAVLLAFAVKPELRKVLAKGLVFGILGGAIVLEQVSNARGVCSGSILGIFSAFALAIHIVLLVPGLRKDLLSRDPEPAPSR